MERTIWGIGIVGPEKNVSAFFNEEMLGEALDELAASLSKIEGLGERLPKAVLRMTGL